MSIKKMQIVIEADVHEAFIAELKYLQKHDKRIREVLEDVGCFNVRITDIKEEQLWQVK